ncbi:hypothetical protein [Ferrovibrio sp.]|uniref:hypothetical protein n=1 Tax=Ferrovibrio sp. TaxID=1917215 RepID=UPI001B5BDAA1|nr:hypothetical protein [Ferrovibrio sp.]MBP7062880.1 hypothetical protein [Ferrovibrio sp.]
MRGAAALLVFMLLPGLAGADTRGQAGEFIGTGPAAYAADANQVAGFAGPDQWIIPRYYQRLRDDQHRAKASRKNMPRDLPAGLSQRPAKGAMLPMNFVRELLPSALLRDLPALPGGIERLVIAQDVVLLRGDGLVLDVLPNVVR